MHLHNSSAAELLTSTGLTGPWAGRLGLASHVRSAGRVCSRIRRAIRRGPHRLRSRGRLDQTRLDLAGGWTKADRRRSCVTAGILLGTWRAGPLCRVGRYKRGEARSAVLSHAPRRPTSACWRTLAQDAGDTGLAQRLVGGDRRPCGRRGRSTLLSRSALRRNRARGTWPIPSCPSRTATADGIRKDHGISGSTLDRRPRSAGLVRPGAAPGMRPSLTIASRTRATRGSLAEINRALQAIACRRADGEVTAVEAAKELDHLGLLRDSPSRPGKPPRDVLRAGRIAHSRQEAGRWWFVRCGPEDGSQP